MIIEISLVLIGLIFLWLLLRLIIGRKLEKDRARKTAEVEKLKKEIYHKKEMKKHLGFHVERDVIPFSEEEKELTEGQIQDEDEELEES
jgi:flagellar biosynthesis/type III secretory pathway M-ring protein FliF/YscJ